MGLTKDGSGLQAVEKESCGQHYFFHCDDEVAYDLGYGKGQIEKSQRYTTSLCLFFYIESYRKACWITPILLSFTRPPTFIGRHAYLEDVTTTMRYRRKTFITHS